MLLTLATSLSLSLAASRPLPVTEEEPLRPWTLLVYGAADNNADGPILEFLDGVRKALDDDPGMELILFIDRAEGFSEDATLLGENFEGARIYRLRKDSAERLDAEEFFPGMSEQEYEVDSADPENIGRFVAYGKKHFPAQRYGLMIYSHANGCTMCPDDESGRDMNIPELTDWVDEEASVDFLALELCNMAGLEIAYQWRPDNGGFSADVLVAIPNAGPPLDWDRAFARIRSVGHASPVSAAATKAPTASMTGAARSLPLVLDPATMSALDFGNLVVEEGYAGRLAMQERWPEEVGHESAGCFDLTKTAAAKKAIDRLAVELAKSDSKEIFEDLRGHGDEGTVLNYARDNIRGRPYVDVYALLERAAACDKLAEGARSAARSALVAVDEVVVSSFGMNELKDFQPGKHGLFLVFPDGSAPSERFPRKSLWSQFSWYSPLEAAHEGAPYGHWAFLADGATPGNGKVENWYELLDAWFDDTSDDPAGTNRYCW